MSAASISPAQQKPRCERGQKPENVPAGKHTERISGARFYGKIKKFSHFSALVTNNRRDFRLLMFALNKNLLFLHIPIDTGKKRAIMQAIEQSMIEARMLRVAPLKDGRNRRGERSSRRRVSDFLIRYIWVVGEYPADCRVSGELSGHLGDSFRGHEQYLLCS